MMFDKGKSKRKKEEKVIREYLMENGVAEEIKEKIEKIFYCVDIKDDVLEFIKTKRHSRKEINVFGYTAYKLNSSPFHYTDAEAFCIMSELAYEGIHSKAFQELLIIELTDTPLPDDIKIDDYILCKLAKSITEMPNLINLQGLYTKLQDYNLIIPVSTDNDEISYAGWRDENDVVSLLTFINEDDFNKVYPNKEYTPHYVSLNHLGTIAALDNEITQIEFLIPSTDSEIRIHVQSVYTHFYKGKFPCVVCLKDGKTHLRFHPYFVDKDVSLTQDKFADNRYEISVLLRKCEICKGTNIGYVQEDEFVCLSCQNKNLQI